MTDLAKQLLSDPISDTIILVIDGTYVLVQCSSFKDLLRTPYSRTTTDGYGVDDMGPNLSSGKIFYW